MQHVLYLDFGCSKYFTAFKNILRMNEQLFKQRYLFHMYKCIQCYYNYLFYLVKNK